MDDWSSSIRTSGMQYCIPSLALGLLSKEMNSADIRALKSCVHVAVLRRLLYDEPIPVKLVVDQPESHFADKPFKPFMDPCPFDAFVTETTAESLHPIVILASVASKGGYIVAGEFRPGHGIETAHLKFSDFKPDDDIMLHLRQDNDYCVPAAVLVSKFYMVCLTSAKKMVENDKALAVDYCEMPCESRELPSSSTYIDQLLTADTSAMLRLKGVLVERRVVTCLRQALYGTPTRLYYTSDHKGSEPCARVVAHLKNVQELCCKKLEEINAIVQ